MIDFDQREADFARLRESLVELDDRVPGATAENDQAVTTSVSEAAMAQTDRLAETAKPQVIYDDLPLHTPYRLRYAFSLNGNRVTELFFAEPSFADVEDRVHGRITEQQLHARMAGVDVEVLRALKWCDSRIATLLARAVAPDLGDV